MCYDKVGDRLKKNWEYKYEYKCVHRPIQFNTAVCLLVYNVLYSLSVSHQVASAQQGRRCDLLTSCHTWPNNTMLWMYNLAAIGARCLQIGTILSKQQEQEQSKNWKRVLDTIMLLCPALRFVFLRWHNMIARGADLNLHFLLPTKLQMTTPYPSSFQNWSKQRVWKRFCIKSLSLVRSSRKTHSRWIERIKTIMIRGWSFIVFRSAILKQAPPSQASIENVLFSPPSCTKLKQVEDANFLLHWKLQMHYSGRGSLLSTGCVWAVGDNSFWHFF